MSEKSIGKNDFLSGPILPPLIQFALPLMLSLLLQAFYGGVDLAVVGRFSPTASVSAVATGSQVMQAVTVIVSGLTMGSTVLVGKAMGARDGQRAGRVVAGQLRLFGLLAVVLTAAMLLFAPQAARLMNVPAEAVDETVRYLRICGAGIVFITAYNGISGVFRGIGNSRSPFLFVLIACLVNVVLDLVFVGLLGMNAAGAALATIIAQAVSVVFSLGYIRRHPLPFAVRKYWREGTGSVGGHSAGGYAHRFAGFPHQSLLPHHHQHREYFGSGGFGRCGNLRKTVCLFVHCAHGLYVGPLHLCGPEHGSRQLQAGPAGPLFRPGHFHLLRRGHVFGHLLCRRGPGFGV